MRKFAKTTTALLLSLLPVWALADGGEEKNLLKSLTRNILFDKIKNIFINYERKGRLL